MIQYNLAATQPAAKLVSAGDGPTLIVNNDPQFTLWLGDNNATSSANLSEVIPIAPNGYLGVDGSADVYGIADSSATNLLNVLVIAGGMSFFQLFSQLVIQGSAAGVFIYAPTAGPGTLIGSWSAIATTDKYGNVVPAGINVFSGQLAGVSLNNAQILSSFINKCVLNLATINQPVISGGTIQETNITFDPTGGRLLIYSQTTTSVLFNTPGDFTWTVPAGITSGKVELTGGSAGGSGGNASRGGETGGGGEYAAEPNYPLTPGTVMNGSVGAGGQGGFTGQSGGDGQATVFDGFNIFAGGGVGGFNFLGGLGGSGSINTVHFNGGNGANAGTTTGGSSGGNSGGPTGAGNNGIQATTTVGAASPVAQTGAGQGGAGGNNAANGGNGSAPGGAGGGAGSGSASNTLTKTYNATSSRTWYGSDGSSPNQTRVSNGLMYQGGETASGGASNGTMKSACLFNSTQIQSDFAGATMTGGSFTITNQHSWYNSGMSVQVKQWLAALGTSLPSTWDGTGATLIGTPAIAEGQRKTFSFGATPAGNFKTGVTRGIALGPGAGSFNLNYYGYFTGTPNSSSGPQLSLSGTTGAGSTQAGSGADGQVKVTFAATQSLIVSLAGAAGTDVLTGSTFPAGLGVLQPSGQYVKVSGASTDVTNFTVTATGNNQFSKAWPIPANDAAVGTVYRLTMWGTGTQGSTQEQLNTNLFLNGAAGTNLDNTNMSSTIVGISGAFHWHYVVEVIITGTGVSGSAVVAGKFTMSQAVATTPTNSATAALSDTGKVINTTAANTLGLFAGWGATTGVPTVTCAGSMFERLGP